MKDKILSLSLRSLPISLSLSLHALSSLLFSLSLSPSLSLSLSPSLSLLYQPTLAVDGVSNWLVCFNMPPFPLVGVSTSDAFLAPPTSSFSPPPIPASPAADEEECLLRLKLFLPPLDTFEPLVVWSSEATLVESVELGWTSSGLESDVCTVSDSDVPVQLNRSWFTVFTIQCMLKINNN